MDGESYGGGPIGSESGAAYNPVGIGAGPSEVNYTGSTGGADVAAAVADTVVTSSGPIGSESGAAFNPVGIGAGPSGGGYSASTGGIASAVNAQSVANELNALGDRLKPVGSWLMTFLGLAANPLMGMAKIGYANRQNIGKPNPYGDGLYYGSNGNNTPTLPASNSFAANRNTAMQGATTPSLFSTPNSGAKFSTSYIPTRSNVQQAPTQQTGVAAVALAVLATLVLS